MIRVRDVERSLEFYEQFVGLRKVRERPIGDEAVLVFLTDDDERYMIELTHNRDGRDYTLGDQFGHLAFFVDELDPVVEDLERRGWEYRRSRPELSSRYIFVKDPDGYDVEIIERRRG
jgi:lactoylglutathione lyase